jgi:hypothetical protein
MEKFYKGEIQRLFPILEAIKEGKTIQWNDMGLWRDIDGDEEGFFLDTLIGKPDGYRIKPKYRHFKGAEECWAEMLKHQPFGWVKLKATRKYFICKAIGDFFAVVGLNDRPTNYDELFEEYIFADGTPFGVKVEE